MASIVYTSSMLKLITISALVITTSAMTLPAYACGFHGGGFGGFGNANWKPYNPQISTEDPALLNRDISQTSLTLKPSINTRPSFSNAANRAALIAKARVAKKVKDQEKQESASKEKSVKKAALNTDR